VKPSAAFLEHFPDTRTRFLSWLRLTRFDDEGPSFRLDTKTLLTALIIAVITGVATAAWATYSTAKELTVQFSYLSRQIAETQAKVDQHSSSAIANQLALSERMARVETMIGMQGNRK
jgi:hypothetical protein